MKLRKMRLSEMTQLARAMGGLLLSGFPEASRQQDQVWGPKGMWQ